MKAQVGVLLFLLAYCCASSPELIDPCEELDSRLQYGCKLAASTDWTNATESIGQLSSSLVKYTEPMTTVVRAVRAIEDETSAYASTIEQAAAAIAAMTATDPNTVRFHRVIRALTYFI